MHRFEIEALTVGDVVGIVPYSSSCTQGSFVNCVVQKINGHGHISVGKTRSGDTAWTFDKRGDDRNASKYRGACIIKNDLALARNKEIQDQRDVNAKVATINEILASAKNGYGSYQISEEVKQKLLEAVNAL